MKELEYPYDAGTIFRYKRRLKKQLLQEVTNPQALKLAVLGGSTTHNFVEILELFLLKHNIKAEFYESEYAQYWQDAVFGNERLDEFKPDLVYIHTSNRNIVRFPDVTFIEEQEKNLLREQCAHFETMWKAIENRYHCPIIQNNFDMLFYRLLGNRDGHDFRGRNHFIEELNSFFGKYADAHSDFYIQDIHYISAAYGLDRWADMNDWYRYKYAMSVNAIPELAANLAAIIKAIYGKNKKFIAVDLDNTLWGGVIGDDGVSAIEIGNETYEGQAFLEFQTYLAELKKLGIPLTVNSKNYEENAIAGLNHPAGILKPTDFAVIQANWENKNKNLVEIAQELQLGVDSGVFLDDNPSEREIVARTIGGAAVPPMNNVVEYIRTVDKNAFFETVSISQDDIRRGEMYKENAQRKEMQLEFADYGDFLRSLNMCAEIERFKDIYLPRIVQLTNKSNQFNLTTRRYTLPEIETLANDEHQLCIYGRLQDKFGDNGIVAISIGHLEGKLMRIDLWLMSCRVLKRDMEQAMMDEFVRLSGEMGADTIEGVYYPTAKNAMVKDFYGLMGFEIKEDNTDRRVWQLNISEYKNQNRYISIK